MENNVQEKTHTMKLRTITFTGVDEWTDIDGLSELCLKYPMIEFGILLSTDYMENGNRFPNPEFLSEFDGRGITLSAHLCGEIAKKAVRNDFDPVRKVCDGRFGLFKRCQLNVGKMKSNPKKLRIDIPEEVSEVIIQQSTVEDMDLFNSAEKDSRLTVLLDNSGGQGIYHPFNPMPSKDKVGYAGGLNIENIERTIFAIEMNEDTGPYWLDMESGVRTDDKFDLEKVREIMKKIFWE